MSSRRSSGGALVAAVGMSVCMACTAAPETGDAPPAATARALSHPWTLRIAEDGPVPFRGVVSHDAAGLDTAPMMYVAPGIVGLFAAVATHGAISSGLRDRQKSQLQLEADAVLQPFLPTLGRFTTGELSTAGSLHLAAKVAEIAAPAEPAGESWTVDTAPVFSMTQDRRALVLDNTVRIFSPGAPKPMFAKTVRVIATPLTAQAAAIVAAAERPPASQVASAEPGDVVPIAAPSHHWLLAEGRHLRDDSIALFVESLDIAVAASRAAANEAAPQRTIRYLQGGVTRVERGQVLAEHCGRMLFRTLRDGLMSVPTAAVCDLVDSREATAVTTGLVLRSAGVTPDR